MSNKIPVVSGSDEEKAHYEHYWDTIRQFIDELAAVVKDDDDVADNHVKVAVVELLKAYRILCIREQSQKAEA